MHELARLDAERRAVDELSVNEDVAVHDHLARLRRGAGNRRTNDDRVETHLELLNQVLTGEAGGLASFFELDLELSLADAVLGA